MKAVDMRSLSQAGRLARRIEVIRLRKAGGTYDGIAVQLGLSRTGVFDICKRHEATGALGLRDRASGRRTGEGRLLDPCQETTLRQIVTDQTPDQLSMPCPLWTREAVQRLVQQRFGIRMPIRTLGTYLARWGFVPRKMLRAASPLETAWSTLDYPSIVARARIEDGEIQWAHTERLCPRGSAFPGRSSSLEPVALIVRDADALHSLTSATNNRGRVRWKIYGDVLTADQLIDFLQRLVNATARKVFLIVQGLPVECAESVASWLDEHVDDIEMFRSPVGPTPEATLGAFRQSVGDVHGFK